MSRPIEVESPRLIIGSTGFNTVGCQHDPSRARGSDLSACEPKFGELEVRLRPIIFGMILVLAACGGGEDGLSDADEVATTAGASAEPDAAGDDDEDAASESGSSSQIDPNDLPEPGEKRLEIDGETFVFTDRDCAVTDTSVGLSGVMGEEAERVTLTVMGRLVGDTWATSITAEGASGVVIHGQGDAVETPVIDGSAVSIEADFVRSESGNFDDSEELGTGRLVANCG